MLRSIMLRLLRSGGVCVLMVSTVLGQDRPFTFTKVVDTSDAAISFSAVPMLSDPGAVVFSSTKVIVDPPASPSFSFSTEYFRYENGSITTIAAADSGMVVLDMSRNGSLLLLQKVKGEPSRLFLDQDGARTQILDTSDSPFSSIACSAVNDNGDVVFAAVRDSGLGGYFLRSNDGSIITLVEEVDLPDLSLYV
jgi:hypothetical protein